jgi:hypothetical protein
VGVQALAAGLALLVSDIGGFIDLIEAGCNGYKLPPGNHDDWEKMLRMMLTDPELTKEFKKHSFKLAERFDINRIVCQYVEIFMQVANQSEYALRMKNYQTMDESMRNKSEKKSTFLRVFQWVITFLSVVLLIWLISRQNWDQILQTLIRIPISTIVIVLMLNFVGQVLNTLRWSILLNAQDIHISKWQLIKIVLAGAFASNFLPSTIGGDVIRLIKINQFSHNQGLNFASIVLDRFVNVVAFLTILPLSYSIWSQAVTDRNTQVMMMATLNLSVIKKWFQKSWSQFISAYKNWAQKPWVVFQAFVVCWFSIFVIFIGLWLLNLGLDIQVKLVQVMGISALSYFITMLPISINGYGLREVSITFFYTLIGVSADQAAIFAVLSRFLILFVTVPGAFFLGNFKDLKQIRANRNL